MRGAKHSDAHWHGAQALDRSRQETVAPQVLALGNKLARIAWAVLNNERKFECVRTDTMASRPA